MKKTAGRITAVLKTIAMSVIIFALLAVFFPRNVDLKTFFNILYQAIAPSVLALGMLFNIKVGNWDFSVGAIAMFAGIYGGQLASRLGLGIFGVILFSVVIGLACGLFNGLLYRVLRIPTIIITIGMCLIYEGFCFIGFNGGGVMLPGSYIVLNSYGPQLIFGLCALVIAFILYNYLPIGYHIRAIGSSAMIANQKGLDVVSTKIGALVIAGVFAGLYAAITLGTSGVYRAATNSMGTLNTCFDAMMCVFVGMCLERFSNLVISVYIGAVVLKYLKLFLMLIRSESAYEQIFIAVFVLVFLCYSTLMDNRRSEKIYKHRTLSNMKV